MTTREREESGTLMVRYSEQTGQQKMIPTLTQYGHQLKRFFERFPGEKNHAPTLEHCER